MKADSALASTGRIFLAVLVIGGGLVLLAWPNFGPHPEHSRTARVKSDQRSLATALEAYFVDHKMWPPLRPIKGVPSQYGSAFPALSTPVAYITAEWQDPFRTAPGMAIYTDAAGYILVSPGADGDFDIERPRGLYRSDDSEKSPRRMQLLTLAYDPTNGRRSSGDVWRVREELPTPNPRP